MNKLLNPRLGQMIIRVVLGVIFVAHGAYKLFGEPGASMTTGFFDQLGIPVPIVAAWLITLLEFVGGMFLIVGLFVLPTALLLAIHMAVGIVLVHAPNGFYVIGPGSGGVEFNLLLIAGLLSILFGGPGYAAVDNRSAPVAAPPPAPQPISEPEPPAPPEPEREPEPTGAGEATTAEETMDTQGGADPESADEAAGDDWSDERPV